jgi:hypothetical protein
MLCEEGITTIEARSALLITQNTKQIAQKKTQNNAGKIDNVVTLPLRSRPRQGLMKVWAKNEAWESHFMFPVV